MSGAKWEAKAYGRPKCAATCAPNEEEPRIHSGTLVPAAGHRLHALTRLHRAEQRLQLGHVLREAVGRVRVAPQCALGVAVAAGRAAESEVDAAGVERGERAELLGDDQRGVVGQHDRRRRRRGSVLVPPAT